MQVAVRQEDADILLKEKNVLNEDVVNKYRYAGQVAQTALKYIISLINDSYHLNKTEKPYCVQDLCILGDSFLTKLLGDRFKNKDKVREKGIAFPVCVEVNEFVGGFSPELDDSNTYVFQAGDIVTISLGAHIDGYTANVSHTVVIYPPGTEIEGELKPVGPLLGSKADSIVATHIASEAVVALLGLSLTPEKISALPNVSGQVVTGQMIRELVNYIADSFNCVVVPGSKIRRLRRFLAGQAEGIVAERDFKGVVWDERDQESTLIARGAEDDQTALVVKDKKINNVDNVIPTDDFTVEAGEVYTVDVKMASLRDFEEPGLITLQEIDQFSQKGFTGKSSIFIRDYAIQHALKLKSARELMARADKNFSVYPFKLAYTCDSFPVDLDESIQEQIDTIRNEIKYSKLGLNELNNRHMVRSKPIQVAKFIPLKKILVAANPSGRFGIDANKPVLPGMEVPLPNLGISSIKLKTLLKHGSLVGGVARESCTVVLDTESNEVLRLTGGKVINPSWVHSDYQLSGSNATTVSKLSELTQDERFGIKIKEVQPLQFTSQLKESMQLD